jgi:acyl carrier protein
MIIDGEERELEGWFDTGDIVTRNEFGGYEISGRASDLVINADGENLNPDIAQRALSISSAISFAVLGNEKNDELILLVQIQDDMPDVVFDALREEVLREIDTLPSAYRIRRVYYTTDMLLEANEIKISRKKLRKRIDSHELRLFDGNVKKEIFTSSDSPVEALLREIFAEVLHTDPAEISSSAHFMNDLGGTSLEYYDVLYRIEERFGVKLDLEGSDFTYTLADFEKIIKEKTDI